MTYKGYELIKDIADGKITDCRLKYTAPFFTKGELEVINKRLVWKPGTFSTDYLTDGITEFEILEEQQDIDIQEIEEIKFRESDKEYLGFGVDLAHSKINELVQAVKQLDRNIKDKE